MVGESRSPVIRNVLGGFLAFGALNAFAGGCYGLSGAEGVPVEWLEGSPFSDYSVPSVILLVVVGGSLLAAAIAVFAASRRARVSAVSAGTVVLVWLAAQVSIIGYVSWMQPATAVGALFILLLAWLLPGRATAVGVTHRDRPAHDRAGLSMNRSGTGPS